MDFDFPLPGLFKELGFYRSGFVIPSKVGGGISSWEGRVFGFKDTCPSPIGGDLKMNNVEAT